MSYEDDCEYLRRRQLPITHYIYCPRSHAHWVDIGGVYGALALSEHSPEQRRCIIHKFMAENRQVRACLNGPYKHIQSIYDAVRNGQTP